MIDYHVPDASVSPSCRIALMPWSHLDRALLIQGSILYFAGGPVTFAPVTSSHVTSCVTPSRLSDVLVLLRSGLIRRARSSELIPVASCLRSDHVSVMSGHVPVAYDASRYQARDGLLS